MLTGEKEEAAAENGDDESPLNSQTLAVPSALPLKRQRPPPKTERHRTGPSCAEVAATRLELGSEDQDRAAEGTPHTQISPSAPPENTVVTVTVLFAFDSLDCVGAAADDADDGCLCCWGIKPRWFLSRPVALGCCEVAGIAGIAGGVEALPIATTRTGAVCRCSGGPIKEVFSRSHTRSELSAPPLIARVALAKGVQQCTGAPP